MRLELKEDSSVLEVGPGPGYFSIPIAKRLQTGRLVLADIQQEMLEYARKRIQKKRIENVDYYLCDGKKIDLQDESFDRIFMVTVIGEIENKQDYIREFYRLMKKDGIISISELAGDPDKLTISEVKDLFENSGFEFYKIYGNDKNYTINFVKK
ncbi:methyltransferase family protein [Mangrovibacterium diazotrophicum]|uniref:Arsenite methyltransferase n=2 Tax=Mangrovibacterium diazotrophicum TaxID=1261403 RepID=A0A419W307_9BACT|nr:methyltransferase family protein [Mangrovibacterium diazotrophicum]